MARLRHKVDADEEKQRKVRIIVMAGVWTRRKIIFHGYKFAVWNNRKLENMVVFLRRDDRSE